MARTAHTLEPLWTGKSVALKVCGSKLNFKASIWKERLHRQRHEAHEGTCMPRHLMIIIRMCSISQDQQLMFVIQQSADEHGRHTLMATRCCACKGFPHHAVSCCIRRAICLLKCRFAARSLTTSCSKARLSSRIAWFCNVRA